VLQPDPILQCARSVVAGLLTAIATPTTTPLCSSLLGLPVPRAVFDRLLTAFFSFSPYPRFLCIENSGPSAAYHRDTEPAHFDIGAPETLEVL